MWCRSRRSVNDVDMVDVSLGDLAKNEGGGYRRQNTHCFVGGFVGSRNSVLREPIPTI
jgi:hypothetical protein